MIVRNLGVMLTVILLSSLWRANALLSADDTPSDKSPANTGQKSDDERMKSPADESDPYEVPDVSAEDLLKFIEDLRNMGPRGKNRKEIIGSFKRALRAMTAAADKILAANPAEKTRIAAISAKLEALGRLSQFGENGTEEQLKKLADELKQGSDDDLAKQAQSILLQLRASKLLKGDAEDAEKLLAEVTNQLAAAPDDLRTVRVALGIAQALEYSGKTDKLAIQAYHDFAKILAKSTNEEVVSYAKQLDGVVRRLELVGKPMEITGTLLNGQPFDQATLKGKVVLVNFWVSRCDPYIAELPDVLNHYQKYHEKGLEVIGISLDQDRTALETFVKDREIPWAILFDGTGSNPMVEKYAIMALPTAILVGADGNVVSLHARGEKLGELLAKLLGPAGESADREMEKRADKES
jgi:peroxiredoxin